jgi:hypothetical protein
MRKATPGHARAQKPHQVSGSPGPAGGACARPSTPLARLLVKLAGCNDELIARWARRLLAGDQEDRAPDKHV